MFKPYSTLNLVFGGQVLFDAVLQGVGFTETPVGSLAEVQAVEEERLNHWVGTGSRDSDSSAAHDIRKTSDRVEVVLYLQLQSSVYYMFS